MPKRPELKPFGLNDFLGLDLPPRELLLDPILPERSLAMLYAPRGLGKSWLSLSVGLAVASGNPLLRWSAPKPRKVLFVDGEMPLVALQERLRSLAPEFGGAIGNDGFRILAADHTDGGINVGSDEGQLALEPLLVGVDLVILDNLSNSYARRAAKAPVMLGCRCKIGCSDFAGGGLPSWRSITPEPMGGSAGHRGERMPLIP